MFKLICNTDPVAASIQNPDGSWNYEKFKNHILTCQTCREFATVLFHEVKAALDTQNASNSMWQYRYIMPDGKWQKWCISEDFKEALKNCQIHAKNQPFELIRHDITETIQKVISILDQSIELQEKTRHAFKSKTIAQSRELTEKAKKILEQII